MANKVYTESVVTLNSAQAEATLAALGEKADALRSKMISATQLGDAKGAKEAEKELNSIRKAMNGITRETKSYADILNNLNGASLNDLNRAAAALNREIKRMKPGTEEFIKKSVELNKVKGRISEVKDMTRETQKELGGFWKKIGWASLAAGAGAVFKKFAQDMVNGTQLVGDKWQMYVSGMQRAYGTFMADLVSGKGWNEMIANMRESYRVGREIQGMLDELFEMNNSLSLEEAEYGVIIEENRKKMRDQTLTDEERLEAADIAMQKEGELAELKRSIASQEHEAAKLALKDQTKLNDEQIEFFIRYYNKNKDVIHQAMDYNATVNDLEHRVEYANRAMQTASDANMMKTWKADLKAAQDQLLEVKRNAGEDVKWVADIAKQYDLGNDELVENYVSSRKKMFDATSEFHRSTARMASTASGLRKTIANEHAKVYANAYKEEIKAAEQKYKEYEVIAKKAYADGEISEVEYNNRLNSIHKNALEEKIQISESYREDTTSYLSQLYDLTIKDTEKLKKAFNDLNQSAEKGVGDFIASQMEDVNSLLAELDVEMQDSIDEDSEHFDQLTQKAAESRARLHPIKSIKAERDKELEELEEAYRNKLISEEDFQKARKQLIDDANSEITDQYTALGDTYFNAVGNLISSFRSANEASLEASMQRELSAAGDNAEKRAAIEQKYEQKQLSLKKKYANIEMGIKIAKTVADGAVAAVKGFAELGPVGGAVFAGVIAATTAAQVATIIAQRNAIMASSATGSGSSSGGQNIRERKVAGFKGGGFTATGASDDTAVGIVHANEWVAPAAMVRANPVTFARLDAARASGSSVPGFKAGGFTTPESPGSPEIFERLLALLEKLNNDPIHAFVVLDEINAAYELQNRMSSKTGK